MKLLSLKLLPRQLKCRLLLAAGLIGFALWHGTDTAIHRNLIHPFTQHGWVREQLSVSFILLVAGVCLARLAYTAGRNTRDKLGLLLLQLGLFYITSSMFLRYFWISAAVFMLLGFLDVIFLSGKLAEAKPVLRVPVVTILAIVFLGLFAFVLASFFWVGN